MRSRESIDEFSIGFGELEGMKFGGFHPSKLCNFDGAKLAARDRAVEEMKFDGLRRIVMRGGEELVENVCFDSDLFAQLPSQCGFQRFVGFDFAAGKFPEAGEMNFREPSREKNEVIFSDDCSSDNGHGILSTLLKLANRLCIVSLSISTREV
jgi:hypothetical protein